VAINRGIESAGPHFNPDNQKHGIMSGHGHAGDMPNLHIPPNGELSVEVINAAITLNKDKPQWAFHPGGTAIVIHANKTTTRVIQPATPAIASLAA
jgi:Cu-Zn family superoxide dismutase